ncbi:MAG: dual specificity protein phosphatase family protein [Candidatus Bathyarchaeota archaeon]|nr:dual specificity protein phosphatase family protein [Candidatus Bathyarchaeota archaeon]
MISRRFAEPARFSWLIEGKLAGSARPESEPQLNWLWNEGLRAIVCLNMECPLDDEQVKKIGFEYAFMPVRDFSAPNVGDMREFVNFVDRMLEQNNPVVVCCGAGIGRTGTMLAAYLVSRCYTPEEALDEVTEKRGISVESYVQRAAIFRYARSVRKCKSNTQ